MKFKFFTATGGIDRRFLEQAVAAGQDAAEADREPVTEPADARILDTFETAQSTTVD